MTFTRKHIFLLVLLTYLLFSSFIIHFEENRQVCSSVNLSIINKLEYNLITEKNILSLLNKNNIKLINEDWNNIKVTQIEEIVRKHPGIKKAICIRTPNNKLKIKIIQYIPIVRIINDKDDYYISNDGTLIPSKSVSPAQVLIVTGNIKSTFALNNLISISKYINNDPFLNAQIEQIYVDKKMELTLTPRIGQQKIIFGTIDNYKKKFTNLQELYKQGFSKTGWTKYSSINLKYSNQVVCTRQE